VSKFGLFIGATLIGAGAMYFYDPEKGNSRRALVRDKFIALGNDLQDDLDIMVRDFQNRSKGMLYEVKGNLNKDGIQKVVGSFKDDGQPQAAEETAKEISSNSHMVPAVGLMVASTGAIVTLMGLVKRNVFGGMLVSAGLSMMAKAFYDVEHRFDPSMKTRLNRMEQGKQGAQKPRTKKQPQASVQ